MHSVSKYCVVISIFLVQWKEDIKVACGEKLHFWMKKYSSLNLGAFLIKKVFIASINFGASWMKKVFVAQFHLSNDA